ERLEQAEDELIAGEVERALEERARFLTGLVTGSRGREAKLLLADAGPEAFGCVEHSGEGLEALSQSCPNRVSPLVRRSLKVETVRRGMASNRLEFRVLGPLTVRVDGVAVPAGGPKQRAVLAQLLLSANRVVSRQLLIDE